MGAVADERSKQKKDMSQLIFRLPATEVHTMRIKLATDQETLQSMTSTLVKAWMAGMVSLDELRSRLEQEGLGDSAD